jgi:hypothetical protein
MFECRHYEKLAAYWKQQLEYYSESATIVKADLAVVVECYLKFRHMLKQTESNLNQDKFDEASGFTALRRQYNLSDH